MKRESSRWKQILVFAGPVLIGVLVLVLAVASRKPPRREDAGEQALPVRFIPVAETIYEPRVIGYGAVSPSRVWQANAEVGGRIVALHPEAEVGGQITAGALILRIDPAEYEIAVARNRAALRGAEAQLAEVDLDEKSLEKRLALERRNLSLTERERRRNLALVRDGSVSETIMEQVEREVVRQSLAVTDLENRLAMVDPRRERARAQLEQARANLLDSQRRLAQTEIRAPFTGLVAVAGLETGQAVRVGERLLALHGIDRVEVEAGIAIGKLLGLASRAPRAPAESAGESLISGAHITARVHLRNTEPPISWDAEVARLNATLDPATRTIGVIVAVDHPQPVTATRPAPRLVKGMYCEVELRGAARNSLVIPRAAVRGDRVMVIDAESRLAYRTVTVRSATGEIVEIGSGLEVGDRIVVSDPDPAVAGTLLEPRLDGELADSVIEAARGGGDR